MACVGTRNAYMVLVGKYEGERMLGRPRHGWEDDIKMNLNKRDWNSVNCIIWLGQGQVVGSSEPGHGPFGYIKSQEYLDKLRNC